MIRTLGEMRWQRRDGDGGRGQVEGDGSDDAKGREDKEVSARGCRRGEQ